MTRHEVVVMDPKDELVSHLGAMRAFALSLTRNGSAADDLVQDTVVKAWQALDRFETGTNMRAWLFTIMRNTYYSNRRKMKREVQDTEGLFASTLSEKPEHDGKMAMRDFLSAYADLGDEQREALALVGAMGFSYEEAAQMTGVAIGTVKSRVNRARQQLVKDLGLDDDGSMEMTDKGTMAVINGDLPVHRG